METSKMKKELDDLGYTAIIYDDNDDLFVNKNKVPDPEIDGLFLMEAICSIRILNNIAILTYFDASLPVELEFNNSSSVINWITQNHPL